MIVDCWNTIGVRGDSSCPELVQHVHCRNCPVYSAAAADLLDVEVPPDYMRHWTKLLALERPLASAETHSAVVFRIGDERLAFPTDIFREIADMRAIRTLPHGRDGDVLGLVSVRGELLICVSLQRILGLPPALERAPGTKRSTPQRLLVIEREANRFVLPVDEVFGIERYRPGDLQSVPATLEKASPTYTKAVLPWRDHFVGLLDDELLFRKLDRSIASSAT